MSLLALGVLFGRSSYLTLTSNGNFAYKPHNGATGLGVSGAGRTGGEIDVNEFWRYRVARLIIASAFGFAL